MANLSKDAKETERARVLGVTFGVLEIRRTREQTSGIVPSSWEVPMTSPSATRQRPIHVRVNWPPNNNGHPPRRECEVNVNPWRVTVSQTNNDTLVWMLTTPGCNAATFDVKPKYPGSWPYPQMQHDPTNPRRLESGPLRPNPPTGPHKYTIIVNCPGEDPVEIDPDMDVMD